MAQTSGKDFGLSGIVLGLTGFLVPSPLPWVDIGLSIGIILSIVAMILGLVAIVKNEKGLGLAAILIGAMPFFQMAVNWIAGLFGGMHWVVSLVLFILAIVFVIWTLFIKK